MCRLRLQIVVVFARNGITHPSVHGISPPLLFGIWPTRNIPAPYQRNKLYHKNRLLANTPKTMRFHRQNSPSMLSPRSCQNVLLVAQGAAAVKAGFICLRAYRIAAVSLCRRLLFSPRLAPRLLPSQAHGCGARILRGRCLEMTCSCLRRRV